MAVNSFRFGVFAIIYAGLTLLFIVIARVSLAPAIEGDGADAGQSGQQPNRTSSTEIKQRTRSASVNDPRSGP
jgi:hypothetical protein